MLCSYSWSWVQARRFALWIDPVEKIPFVRLCLVQKKSTNKAPPLIPVYCSHRGVSLQLPFSGIVSQKTKYGPDTGSIQLLSVIISTAIPSCLRPYQVSTAIPSVYGHTKSSTAIPSCLRPYQVENTSSRPIISILEIVFMNILIAVAPLMYFTSARPQISSWSLQWVFKLKKNSYQIVCKSVPLSL